MTRYENPGWDIPGWDESIGEPAVPEPPDVADLMLWRDAQRLFGRHAGAGPDGRCVWCSCPWPCPPRRLAERAEAASRRWWGARPPQQGPDHPVSPAVPPVYPVSPAVPPDYPVSPAVSPGYPVSPAVPPVQPAAAYHYQAGPAYDFDEPDPPEEPRRTGPGPDGVGLAYDRQTPDTPAPRPGPPAQSPPGVARNSWADLVNYAYPMR